jgi:hypothetical protein
MRCTSAVARRVGLVSLLALGLVAPTDGRADGLERRPLMAAFDSWNWIGARVDCDAEPYRCMSEVNIRGMADAAVSSGLAAAGYEYVIVSESWPAASRAPNGSLIADPARFPSGMPALAAYIRARGLRFGIYLDVGAKTCAGYPGSEGNEELDIATIASWGAEYLWLDGCNFNGTTAQFVATYGRWGALLNASGQRIAWECSLPAYIPGEVDLNWVGAISHEWRYFDDIRPAWDSVTSILDATVAMGVGAYARPGQYPLMDMLEVGNEPLTVAESRAHFSLVRPRRKGAQRGGAAPASPAPTHQRYPRPPPSSHAHAAAPPPPASPPRSGPCSRSRCTSAATCAT